MTDNINDSTVLLDTDITEPPDPTVVLHYQETEPASPMDDAQSDDNDEEDQPPAIITRQQYSKFIGRLMSKDNMLLISQNVIEIGRNSSKSQVDFHVGKNHFVSRKHLTLRYDGQDFEMTCSGKNGIFIDGIFQRFGKYAQKLPAACTLRFPSTNIRLQFENLADQNLGATVQQLPVPSNTHSPANYVPDRFPSPTNTMSAANSCPTSPHRRDNRDHDVYAALQSSNGNSHQNNEFSLPSTSGSCILDDKPLFSYAQLIVQAISAASDKQLTLSGIYSYISKTYPYYRTGANKGWQNSIRHNLSLNRYFLKVPRSQEEPGKGSFWRIDPTLTSKLVDQSYRKRRLRGDGTGFRLPISNAYSAPVSPSQMENSPINEVILQSAPGSPRYAHNPPNYSARAKKRTRVDFSEFDEVDEMEEDVDEDNNIENFHSTVHKRQKVGYDQDVSK